MAGRISDEDIQRVRDASDLVQLVSEITPVQTRGNDAKCCCPFHNEKTPSFHINPELQLWHCFGCGEGGDLFKFVMRSQNVTFPEAVRMLAQRANIEIKDSDPKQTNANKSQRARLKEICARTAHFYHQSLMCDPSAGPASARSYLSSRNMGGEIPKTWNLGYAPGSAKLTRHLYNAGYKYEEMVLANVAVKGRDGKYHDRFFNRVMFPIYNVAGEVVAFGGRVIDKGEPKYLNSSDTPLFHKSEVLYGMHLAKDDITCSGVAVIVEGYTDVIACHAAGIKNVVATLGTALTQRHLRLLARYAKQSIIYLFDGDAAGQRAADRALGFINESITPEGSHAPINLKAVTLPNNLDPAEYIKAHGAEALQNTLEDAKQLIQYGIDRRLEQNDLSTPEGRSMAFSQAMKILAPIKTSVLAQQYACVIANATNMSETTALDALRKLKVPQQPRSQFHSQQQQQNQAQSQFSPQQQQVQQQSQQQEIQQQQQSPQAPVKQPKDNRSKIECTLLSVCVHNPQVMRDIAEKINSINFHNAFHAKLAQELIRATSENPRITPPALLSKMSENVPAAASYLTGASYDTNANPNNLANYLCESLLIYDTQESIDALRAQAKTKPDDDDLFHAIVDMQRELNKRKSAHKPI